MDHSLLLPAGGVTRQCARRAAATTTAQPRAAVVNAARTAQAKTAPPPGHALAAAHAAAVESGSSTALRVRRSESSTSHVGPSNARPALAETVSLSMSARGARVDVNFRLGTSSVQPAMTWADRRTSHTVVNVDTTAGKAAVFQALGPVMAALLPALLGRGGQTPSSPPPPQPAVAAGRKGTAAAVDLNRDGAYDRQFVRLLSSRERRAASDFAAERFC